jgi:hypothetical protein
VGYRFDWKSDSTAAGIIWTVFGRRNANEWQRLRIEPALCDVLSRIRSGTAKTGSA